VRPPLVKITDAEIALIKDALIEAELLGARTAMVPHASNPSPHGATIRLLSG